MNCPPGRRTRCQHRTSQVSLALISTMACFRVSAVYRLPVRTRKQHRVRPLNRGNRPSHLVKRNTEFTASPLRVPRVQIESLWGSLDASVSDEVNKFHDQYSPPTFTTIRWKGKRKRCWWYTLYDAQWIEFSLSCGRAVRSWRSLTTSHLEGFWAKGVSVLLAPSYGAREQDAPCN